MWRLKYLIIGMILPAAIGVGGYFAAGAIADELRSAVREAASDAVAETFQNEVPNRIEPGQITISESQLAIAFEDTDRREGNWNINGLDISIDDGRVSIIGEDDDRNSSDDVTFASAVPLIQDGVFVLTDRRGALSIFKSAQNAIADEIELQVAALFVRSGVVPVSVTAENGRLTIVTEADPSAQATEAAPDDEETDEASPEAVLDTLGRRTPTPTP